MFKAYIANDFYLVFFKYLKVCFHVRCRFSCDFYKIYIYIYQSERNLTLNAQEIESLSIFNDTSKDERSME